jgi:hypothetical protein
MFDLCDTTTMPHIVKRTTKAGSLSTAFVEAYRDDQGRPRKRLLANLHGETDLLRALAKVALLREALRKERTELSEALDRFDDIVCAHPMEQFDRIVRAKDQAATRLKRVDSQLAAIQRDGVAIKKHCAATASQVQEAIRGLKNEIRDLEYAQLGAAFHQEQARAKLRRLRR